MELKAPEKEETSPVNCQESSKGRNQPTLPTIKETTSAWN
jgi:hypothetical protein